MLPLPSQPVGPGHLSIAFTSSADSTASQPASPSLGQDEKEPSPLARRHHQLSAVWWLIKDQWFILTLAALILVASQVQVPSSGQDMKEIAVTYLCVAVVFFTTGCTLSTRVLVQNYVRWKIHLFVQVQCFLVTSATMYGIVSLCATNPNFMNPGLLVGMIFLGCIPTTIASNVLMTRQAHGNNALTVVESTIGNLLGPFLTPLLIEMYVSSGAWYTEIIPTRGALGAVYARVFKQLGLSIFLPLVRSYRFLNPELANAKGQAIGQFLQYLLPNATKTFFIKWHMRKLASFALLILIWQVFDSAFETGAFGSVKGSNLVFIVFISIAIFVLWTTMCVILSLPWLGKKDTIAVAYCVPAKSPAMGVPLSVVLFTGLSTLTKAEIQIPLVIFQGLQIVGGSLMTLAFRRWIRPEERLDAEKQMGTTEEVHHTKEDT